MKKNRIIHAAILAILLAGMLAGCAQPTTTPTEVTEAPVVTQALVETAPSITVTDTLGREVAFEKLPERIVVAGKATALLVNTLYMFPEAATRIVAIENRSQNPDAFIPLVDPTYVDKLVLEKNAGPEAIAPSQPDVVILKATMKEKLGDPLEAIGIKVIYLDLETPDAFYRDLQTVGALFGNNQRADEITAFYQGRVSQVTEALKGLTPEEKVSVLLLQHSIEENVISYEVPPANWLQTILVETAGTTPVWKDANVGDGWQTVTLDQIAAWNPMAIAIIDYSGGAVEAVAAIEADSTWQQLDAVKGQRVSAFPIDYLSWDQPDPRWILGLQWLAYINHPDKFPTFDLQSEVLGFYESLYGLDKATISETIFPLISGTLVINQDISTAYPVN
jgi:iron complex transport system substrate-binding protein